MKERVLNIEKGIGIKMERQELYHMIDLPPEIIRRLCPLSEDIDFVQAAPYLEQLTDRETAAAAYQSLKAYLREDADNMKMLFCQLECARRVHEKYRAMHIAESVYVDTMKCFARFIEECGRKNGRLFFDRGWWTYRQVSMGIFRIGTLEYEFVEHEGERAIAVHIPSDADLSVGAVDCSLEQAASFFRTYYPNYVYGQYICESWLLSPALLPLLSEKSNIAAFRKRFTIVHEDWGGPGIYPMAV